MSTLQLNYAFITPPNPYFIVAGQTAELEFTVSNSGNPVTLCSLAFTFPYGSAGSDLCASVSDVSAPNLPGPGWTAGTDESGNFILTPPKGSISVGVEGLTFTLSIQVNSQSGVINLNNDPKLPVQSFIIIESTGAGKADWSSPVPLPKFPVAFQFADLVAEPADVNQGGTTELSWAGTADATYTIDWPTDKGITYSGGQPPITNQSDTSFPPQHSGQTLTLNGPFDGAFSVTAEYSSGGPTLHTAPLTVSVGVSLTVPTITSFTATWNGTALEIEWSTKNATGVMIPAITQGTQNPNSGAPLIFTPSSTQPLPSSITLTAVNQGSEKTSSTLQESYPQVVSVGKQSLSVAMSVAMSPDGNRVYVANSGDHTLTVLDAGTLQPIAGSPVSIGDQPVSVAVSPDGKRVYVVNQKGGTLTVLDAGMLQPIAGSPISVGDQPVSVAVSPDGIRIFVANQLESGENPGALTVLDAGTLQPISGLPVPVGRFPVSVAVSPDSRRVFVANEYDSTLTVLDARTLQQINGSPVPVGSLPKFVAVSPDGARVFVANFDSSSLTVVDAQTLQPIADSWRTPFPAGYHPRSIAVSPDSARVFVADSDTTLTVLTRVYVPANGR